MNKNLQNSTPENREGMLRWKYYSILELRMAGLEHDQIAEKTGYTGQYIRKLFARGGKLHDVFEKYQVEGTEAALKEANIILFGGLPKAARAMVMTAQMPFSREGVAAGKVLFEYTMGKPTETVKLDASLKIFNFSDWAKAQMESIKEKQNAAIDGAGKINTGIQEQP